MQELNATNIITALAPTLPHFLAAGASAMAYWHSRKNRQQGRTIIDKAEQIHQLTNSNLTAVKDELKAANDKITALEGLVKALIPTAAVVPIAPVTPVTPITPTARP